MYFLEKAKTHSLLNEEVMSVKRMQKLLGVASKEHGELVRLRNRVLKPQPGMTHGSIHGAQSTKNRVTQLDTASFSEKALQAIKKHF